MPMAASEKPPKKQESMKKKKSYTDEELAEREERDKKVAELRKSKVQGSIVEIVNEARSKDKK